MASREKKPPLTEIDLARAATAPEHKRTSIVRAGAKEGGYPYYRGFSAALPVILRTEINPLLPASRVTKRQIARVVTRSCGKRTGEKRGNCSVALALHAFVEEREVTAVEFIHDPVLLGRAGKRRFWFPFLLKIGSKRYIVFIDPRLRNGLDEQARTFFFSIMNTYIRLQDEIQYGNLEFLVLQFEKPVKGKRNAIAHFDDKRSYWSDRQLGDMVDAVYRVLDAIERKKAA